MMSNKPEKSSINTSGMKETINRFSEISGKDMSRRTLLGLLPMGGAAALLYANHAHAKPLVNNSENPMLGFYNVTDYGALPDNGEDNSQAIQDAIDDAGNGGGGIVFFPPGDYRIEGLSSKREGLKLRENVGLLGIGRATRLIASLSEDEDFLSWHSPTMYGYGGFLRDLTVEMVSGRDIVSLSRWGRFYAENVTLVGSGYATRYGVYMLEGIDTHFRNVYITRAKQAGLWIGAESSVHTSTSFENCFFDLTYEGPGADIAGIGISFDSCVFQSNGKEDHGQGVGLRVRGGEVTVAAPYFENNASHDMHVGTESDTYISILGGLYISGTYKQPDSIGIYLQKVKGGVILGGNLRMIPQPLVLTDEGSGVTVTGIDVVKDPKYIKEGIELDTRYYPGFISYQKPYTGAFEQSGAHGIRIGGGKLISKHFSGSIELTDFTVKNEKGYYAIENINVPGALTGDLVMLRSDTNIPAEIAMKAIIRWPNTVEVCIYHIPQSTRDAVAFPLLTIHAEVFRISPDFSGTD